MIGTTPHPITTYQAFTVGGLDNGDIVGALGAHPDPLSGLVHPLSCSCELRMLVANDSERSIYFPNDLSSAKQELLFYKDMHSPPLPLLPTTE